LRHAFPQATIAGVEHPGRAYVFAPTYRKALEAARIVFATTDLVVDGLPFRARTFDAVVFAEVIEHLPPSAVPDVLAEIGRVLMAARAPRHLHGPGGPRRARRRRTVPTVTAPGPRTPYAEHRLDLGESRLRKLLRLLAGEPRGRVLDVGCAGGELAEILHARGWRVDGVEREPELVRTAERHGIAVRLSDFDREPLPWDTATFDAAVAGEVIEHVVDTDHLLGELARVIRPGGALVVTTPNLASLENRLRLLF